MTDLPVVGGKNASLGEMYSTLSSEGIRVPDGFATTADAFWHFIDHNELRKPLQVLMSSLDRPGYTNLSDIGTAARALFEKTSLPDDLSDAILRAYSNLSSGLSAGLSSGQPASVAVRSSATAEDLPEASFAGQHESFLNIKGGPALLHAVRKCYASLFTDRAIKYREEQGFPHEKVALSVGIQHMVRADKGCAGVCFTLEPESGFRNIVHISGVWGLGENIVQGESTPDEYLVFKPSLEKRMDAILQKKAGAKEKTLVYADSGDATMNIVTPVENRRQFVLSNEEITALARSAVIIERHYGKPMDIEWAKDGLDGQIYIVQARPETVQSRKSPWMVTEYEVTDHGACLSLGEAVGSQIISARARLLSSPAEAGKLQDGEIIVTDVTSPDWDPILKRAAAIVTNRGGRTSHASIVARELGVPAIVGTGDASTSIQDGSLITVSCCEGKTGYIYEGKADWKKTLIDLGRIPLPTRTRVMLIMADPERAFELSFYPNHGIGLLRMEFIVTHMVQIHPMALVNFDNLQDEEAKRKIQALTFGYPDRKRFFVERLAAGIATMAAAFYPKDVIVRMSDFKTNEYANLLGGKEFEPHEENPMLGFRGASRYYSDRYREGFRLECEAIRLVRNNMGLTNVKVMIPFCRTLEEGRKVLRTMAEFGLPQHKNGLEVYVMAEVPSNVLLAEDFAAIFDGFSIGSNDLTQLTLGVDRDSSLIAGLFDEQDKASRMMVAQMIEKGSAANTHVGFCGQAPSDFPDYAQFLVKEHIDSISFNADALLKGIENINKAEAEMVTFGIR
jgi:pyruvate,water dikinase